MTWGAAQAHTDLVRPRSAASRRHLSASPFNARPDTEPVESFAEGDRVSHDTYGLGRVMAIDSDTTVVVQFSARQMRFATPYAKLFKL
jgi:transcription elongation factor GreA-like protein